MLSTLPIVSMPLMSLLTRRHLIRSLSLGATALAVSSHGVALVGSRERVSLAVGNKSALQHLPLTLAVGLGFFRGEGLEVDIQDHADDLHALQSVVDGRVEIALIGYEQAILQQMRPAGRQLGLQSIVLQCRAPQMALGLASRHLGLYQDPADLRGKRIGISVADTYSLRVPQLVLAQAGVRMDEVEWVALDSSSAVLSALRLGRVDAISIQDPQMSGLEHRGEVRVIADTRTLNGTRQVFGGLTPATCMGASRSFVKRHPQVCQALAYGMVHALKWLQSAEPSDILKGVPEAYLQGDRALYLTAFSKMREAFSPDGVITSDGPGIVLRALARVEPGVRTERIELPQTYTNEFARRAKDRFKA